MALTPDTRLRSREHYSIGDVASLTGIAPGTIRVWERRYGRPKPIRLDSGHRRYSAGQVRWLRLVSTALALGHQASKVMRLNESGIAELVDARGHEEPNEAVEAILEATRRFDGASIRLALERRCAELGARAFLLQVVAPTLERLGEAWVKGTVEIRHEHFVSDILEDELRSLRTSLRESDRGPLVLFATLPEERHSLGLQLAALVGALAGLRVKILGTSLPKEQISEAAAEIRPGAVAISVSLASGGVETDRVLSLLRDALPRGVRLVVGGRGARGIRRGPRGIEYPESLEEFEQWTRKLIGATSQSSA